LLLPLHLFQSLKLNQQRRQLSLAKVTRSTLKPLPHLLQRSLQLSKAIDADDDDDDDDFDVIAQVAYRNPRLSAKRKPVEDDVSDEIAKRLQLAREKALDKFREVWG
jgi:hypothetical protein